MRIWLDDQAHTVERRGPPPSQKWDFICTTAEEAIEAIQNNQITFIDFDHDLGPEPQLTGYDVAKLIEKRASEGHAPPAYSIHSANTVGKARIDAAMKAALKIYYGH